MDQDIDQQAQLESKFKELSLNQQYQESLLTKEIKSLLHQRGLPQIQRKSQHLVQQDDQLEVKNQDQKEVEKRLRAIDFIPQVVDQEEIPLQLNKNENQERLQEQNKFEKSQNLKSQVQWSEPILTPHTQVQINLDHVNEKRQRKLLKLERSLQNERTVKKT